MSKSSKGEGIKIAQAAKDLGVTSVTIRRYISEFNIETTEDENGIKVLPENAMEELYEVRRLKEEGLTNPNVLERLEEMRAKGPKEKKEPKKTAKRITEAAKKKEETRKPEPRRAQRKVEAPAAAVDEDEDEEEVEAEAPEPVAPVEEAAEPSEEGAEGEAGGDGRTKHTLTCQTCSKTFEHMNPRLRDCLECYRAKRKERRREKHKNVIQHPLAAQVANKQQQREQREPREGREPREPRERASRFSADAGEAEFDVSPTPSVVASPLPMSAKRVNPLAGTHKVSVRNYRKAIEETRQITANLKRRLERPDLPENERRWLEQIYAYQLILHQGWRHLAEYKAGTPAGQQRPQET